MMISSLEKAKSNKSTCTICRKFILKDELRGAINSSYFGYNSKKYSCSKCSETIIMDNLDAGKKMLKQLKAVKKPNVLKNATNTSGTSLQGYIKISYQELIETLGTETSNGDGYKTDAEWELELDGVVFTIYNYKDGKNYNGESGTEKVFIVDWHIGGFNSDALLKVKELFPSNFVDRDFTTYCQAVLQK